MGRGCRSIAASNQTEGEGQLLALNLWLPLTLGLNWLGANSAYTLSP
jgi:hypothetical protein